MGEIGREHCIALMVLNRLWTWDGDLMRCRGCGSAIVASRDGEPLHHKSGCKNAMHEHPWTSLREAITPVQGER